MSHHQGTFDLARTHAEGFEYAFLKATEGSSFVDSRFAANLANARAAGLLVAAYHYQRGDSTAAAQAAHIMRTVPADVPIVLDVEANGGDANLTRDIVRRLVAAGWRSPLLYLPRWYWQQIGSPSLAGLPPLWYSRYANNQGGAASDIYERNADWFAQHWAGYGGLGVAVLQFTSSATVAGHTPVDANAYQGSREQLAALLGTNPTPNPEDDLTPEQAQKLNEIHHELFGPRGPQGQIVGWGTKAGNHTAIGMLVQIVNALIGPAASRVPGSTVQVTAVDAIRNVDGITYQLPALIAAAGHTDPAEVAAALRPIVADVVGPVVGDVVRAALGADNDATAAAIVDGIADRLAATGAAA
ncbi:glycoside hydrolase family 25 protein [Saccharopolyspora sp. 6V]|uniref:glycoside hydrolase family 25 protein n=1 Tax=Saccharopolyspora sp. 6V TaxID=2877239 RepID=UPI001CD3C039|nr:glycoside hydrolase family 25 protein [Saccharopolyspora sp. 6V]MCA1195144.1 glycoside hydrolase family 25 protein [Saccharopolyspora sp. 6V]